MDAAMLNGKTAKEIREAIDPKTVHNRALQIFAVFDKKAVAFANPFFYHQKGQALRGFEDAVNDPQSPLSKHPEDFSLWHIGEWNDITGVITSLQTPVHVEEALSVKK